MLGYAQRVVKFNSSDFWKEISFLCTKAGAEPKHYLIFRDTGGENYVLRFLASDLYLSGESINRLVRQKLVVLKKFIKTDIMNIRRDLGGTTLSSWGRSGKEEQLSELCKVFLGQFISK